MPLLYSALVACSMYLLTACISSQWSELTYVLQAHPKVYYYNLSILFFFTFNLIIYPSCFNFYVLVLVSVFFAFLSYSVPLVNLLIICNSVPSLLPLRQCHPWCVEKESIPITILASRSIYELLIKFQT